MTRKQAAAEAPAAAAAAPAVAAGTLDSSASPALNPMPDGYTASIEEQTWDGGRVIQAFECSVNALQTRACSKFALCFSEDAIVNDPFGTITKGRPALLELCSQVWEQFQGLKYSCEPYFVNKNGLGCKCSTALVVSNSAEAWPAAQPPADQLTVCVVLMEQIITAVVNAEYKIQLLHGLYNDTAYQLELEKCSTKQLNK